ncbi:uncharacterized protein DUF2851 [Thermosporothrix hazakensis]|jgi:hypothetical protein|uniref:Uncharacterized protein DUF2851 n=1 Tax=Thermosporothrix hazakensis TaxID=644383 RepID=A0A326U8A8_THEHA|nr:DUF2851 family protein [Thermosporothrix hazakensis]PZW22552.1 uncharacterized protein DUF2851 [Thermosporothrix hazakensis]GCE48525.1 hypothetical protein KTH_33940 [Thermosporothrix hazakensis]
MDKPLLLCERHSVEQELAKHWWSLPQGTRLLLQDGSIYHLHFAGYIGTSAGPDVRDIVLKDVTGSPLYGDAEFHLRASDWYAHRHQDDIRYNRVILHIVQVCDLAEPVQRQDGQHIPTCSLADIPQQPGTQHSPLWPCQQTIPQLSREEQHRLFRTAGLLRFEQRVQHFIEQLREQEDYDTLLIPAIAESLGYGRDRQMFRALGHVLLQQQTRIPYPASEHPAQLDQQRLQGLQHLIVQWQESGAWAQFASVLEQPFARLRSSLRQIFCQEGISQTRADIIICNVILPFAGAVALLEQQEQLNNLDDLHSLYNRVEMLYSEYPGLVSNHITRRMRRQLRLSAEPIGACQQQGLHYIYRETCQQKRCEECIASKYL